MNVLLFQGKFRDLGCNSLNEILGYVMLTLWLSCSDSIEVYIFMRDCFLSQITFKGGKEWLVYIEIRMCFGHCVFFNAKNILYFYDQVGC